MELIISYFERAQKRQPSHRSHKSQSWTWTGMNPHFLPQNRDLTNHFANFHTRGVRLWLDHLGFSLTWKQHHLSIHYYWNPWGVQWRLSPHLEYLPEQRQFWSQYFDCAKLVYTEKSILISLWTTGPLDNMSSRFQETVSYGYPLSENIVPWISR